MTEKKITTTDDCIFPYGDDTTLDEMDAMDKLEALENKEVIEVDSFDIFGRKI